MGTQFLWSIFFGNPQEFGTKTCHLFVGQVWHTFVGQLSNKFPPSANYGFRGFVLVIPVEVVRDSLVLVHGDSQGEQISIPPAVSGINTCADTTKLESVNKVGSVKGTAFLLFQILYHVSSSLSVSSALLPEFPDG